MDSHEFLIQEHMLLALKRPFDPEQSPQKENNDNPYNDYVQPDPVVVHFLEICRPFFVQNIIMVLHEGRRNIEHNIVTNNNKNSRPFDHMGTRHFFSRLHGHSGEDARDHPILGCQSPVS
jgi:hypothetical protein